MLGLALIRLICKKKKTEEKEEEKIR